jgi:hypothetical protein
MHLDHVIGLVVTKRVLASLESPFQTIYSVGTKWTLHSKRNGGLCDRDTPFKT